MHINSIEKVIETLGGSMEVSRLLGIWKTAPANWVRRGRLPISTFPTLNRELARKGHTAAPRLWGMRLPHGMRLTVKVNGKGR